MNVFVSGASGFLGRSIVNQLMARGHVVSPLLRKAQKKDEYVKRGCMPIIGSMETITEWAKDLRGCQVVIHAAAPMVFWGKWSMYQSGIVSATRDMYLAAKAHGVKRFIYISSESVLQARMPLVDIDENRTYIEPDSMYGLAKQQAEKWLLEQTDGPEIIILRPTFIWGKGSAGLESIVKKVRSKQFIWVDAGAQPFEAVHVENVAAACICALNHGVHKGVYYITDGVEHSAREFIGQVLEALDYKTPEKSVPGFIVYPMAVLIEWLWRMLHLGFTPPLTRFETSFISLPRRYNIERARKELGYKPVITIEQGLKELALM
ncbi:MAG: NAD(P)-dependent oxidoreductase [Gammaproteobacteria bacterium]|nr:NAD(P)-dependent oxidoreductase [Gammaproteobacteria bacterium]